MTEGPEPRTSAGKALLRAHNGTDEYLGWIELPYADMLTAVLAIEAEASALDVAPFPLPKSWPKVSLGYRR